MSHCEGEFLSSIFLVPKTSGDLRPVINLKSLNEFVETIHFKMESIGLVEHLLRPGDFCASADLTDAYFSILIRPADRKYLRFTWRDKVYEFTCLPFGYKLAPRVFTKVLKPVYASLRFRQIRVIYYIDDTLIIANSKEECALHASEVCNLLSSLGFTVNKTKSQLIPSQRTTFLGFVVDSVAMTLSLPDDKVSIII